MNAHIRHIKSLAIAASLGALWFPAAVHAKSEPVLPAVSCGAQQQMGADAALGTWVSPAGHVKGGYGVALPTFGETPTMLAPCDAGQLDLGIETLLRAAGIVGTYVTPTGHVKGGYGIALPVLAHSG